MADESLIRTETVVDSSEEVCPLPIEETNEVKTKKQKSLLESNPDVVINSLEDLIVGRFSSGYYNKLGDCVRLGQKITESLSGRSIGTGKRTGSNTNEGFIHNKAYTLDANGRVCLIKDEKSRGNNAQEIISLQEEVRKLKQIRESAFISLEFIMEAHRKMMMKHVNAMKLRKSILTKKMIDDKSKVAEEKMENDFIQICHAVDSSLEHEQEQSKQRRKISHNLSIENFLLQEILKLENIKDANPEELARKWRNRTKVETNN